jgi:PAS domain S-box-containing protein
MSSMGKGFYPFESRPAFVMTLVLAFLVIFGLAGIIGYKSCTKAVDGTIRSNETHATLLAKLILEHQRAAIGVLQLYADQPFLVDSVKKRDFEGTVEHLANLVKNNPEMDWPFITDSRGTLWVNYPVDRQAMNKDLSYREWYKGVSKERKPYISGVYKLIVGEKDLAVAVSTPIFDEKGKVIGILSTSQRTAFFQKFIGEVGPDPDTKTTLVDQEGHIICSNRSPYTKEIIGYPPFEFAKRAMKGDKGNVKVHDVSDRDRFKYVSFVPIEGTGWSIFVEKARSDVLRSEYSYLVLVGVTSLLIYGFAVLSLVRVRNRHRQIEELEKLNEELDDRVRQRTAELEAGNKALREGEERLRQLIETSPVAIGFGDSTGKIFEANESFYRLTGYIREEIQASQLGWNQLTAPEYAELDRQIMTTLAATGSAGPYEKEYVRKDGSRVPLLLSVSKLPGRDEHIAFILDITDRKRTEEERERLLGTIREEKERLLALINSIQDEVWFADAQKSFTLANPSALREFGVNGSTGIDVREFAQRMEVYRPDGTPRPVEEAPPLRALQGEFITNQEEVIRTPRTGELRARQVSATPVRDTSGNIIGSVSVVRDITERKKAEEVLQQRTLELQHLTETLEQRVKDRTVELADLSARLVSAQENERKRISYDLHDNVWQTLVAIRFEIERLFSRIDKADWAALPTKSEKIRETMLNAVGKIRSMQGDLWPYVLDDIGIVATLDWYCREFEKNHSGLAIERKNDLTESEIPASAKIVIYRILQETLSNVAKHSQANHVIIRLLKNGHGVEFSIQDNGIGFDPEETIARKAPWGGLGLLSIKARTELSGGSFGIESAKGKGTTIRASWPL